MAVPFLICPRLGPEARSTAVTSKWTRPRIYRWRCVIAHHCFILSLFCFYWYYSCSLFRHGFRTSLISCNLCVLLIFCFLVVLLHVWINLQIFFMYKKNQIIILNILNFGFLSYEIFLLRMNQNITFYILWQFEIKYTFSRLSAKLAKMRGSSLDLALNFELHAINCGYFSRLIFKTFSTNSWSLKNI